MGVYLEINLALSENCAFRITEAAYCDRLVHSTEYRDHAECLIPGAC
jgi:hypothetical protein